MFNLSGYKLVAFPLHHSLIAKQLHARCGGIPYGTIRPPSLTTISSPMVGTRGTSTSTSTSTPYQPLSFITYQPSKMPGRREPWRNQERHYCQVCNAWMGSDRQSILLHENGKKHKENMEKAMLQKRQERSKQEKDAKALQDSLQAIEAAARQSHHSSDVGLFAQSMPSPVVPAWAPPPPVTQSSAITPPQQTQVSSHKSSSTNKKQEKSDWESKKQQRQDEKRQKRANQTGEDDEPEDVPLSQHKKRRIGETEGYYSYDNQTYLDGVVFGDMLEEEMPLQIWTGNLLASAEEKKLPERHTHWRSGIAAAVRQKPSAEDYEDRLVVDVAYLREVTDTEETLDKSVPLNRIRIVLGSDEMIPNTIEEARIMAMGGEEIVNNTGTVTQEEIDEATGLTSWSTVSVKKTTVHQELKEERERLRQKRRETIEASEKAKREADMRKMEEAKVANADDSALGAYDVWSRSKEGYKGIDIHGEAQVDVHDLGKRLSDGNTAVGFKKSSFKAKKKKQNRRTTSADDD